jgi:hypothetical protein
MHRDSVMGVDSDSFQAVHVSPALYRLMRSVIPVSCTLLISC